jgi:DNA helicase HerA-like ATPase
MEHPGHVIIVGSTMSGKTTLARQISRELVKHKQMVIVYDPMHTATAGGDWGDVNSPFLKIYDDEEEWHNAVWESQIESGTYVFVDEAADIFNHQKLDYQWMLRKGRHAPHSLVMHLITQRPKMVPPNIRTQMGHAYMFMLAPDDREELGKDLGQAGMGKIALDTGDFIYIKSGKQGHKTANIFQLLEGKKK